MASRFLRLLNPRSKPCWPVPGLGAVWFSSQLSVLRFSWTGRWTVLARLSFYQEKLEQMVLEVPSKLVLSGLAGSWQKVAADDDWPLQRGGLLLEDRPHLLPNGGDVPACWDITSRIVLVRCVPTSPAR